MEVSSVVKVILAIVIFIFLWVMLRWMKYWKDVKTIDQMDGVSGDMRESQRKLARKRLIRNLFGFTVRTWVLFLGQFALVIVGVGSFMGTVENAEKISRPYIGLVQMGTSTNQIQAINNTLDGYFIVVPIKNYGTLPAYYSATTSGWYVPALSFQNESDFLMPGQERYLRWNLKFSTSSGLFVSDICSLIEKVEVTIIYQSPGNKIYHLFLKNKFMDNPLSNREVYPYFDSLAVRCGGSGKENQVQTWYVENLD